MIYLLIYLVWHVLELELVRKTTFTKAGLITGKWAMKPTWH